MNILYLLIPATTALATTCCAWLISNMLFYPEQPKKVFGFFMQGIVPKEMPAVINNLSKLAADALSLKQIEEKIADPENLEKIMPLAEEHIDHFLRVKLQESMPMISMFIGDKTINELKKIFMEELRILFPSAMKSYMNTMEHDFDFEKILQDKMSANSTEKIISLLKRSLSKNVKGAIIFAAIFGFVIGLLQLLLVELSR